MPDLTHAVFDAPAGGDQVGPGYPNVGAALAAAAALGGPSKGYHVDRIRWTPEPAAIVEKPKKEAPRAPVAVDQDGPGLFD